MPSYGLTRRFRLLIIALLSSVGLLTYTSWHSVSQAPLAPQDPPLYEQVRAKEQSLAHYEDYEHMNVKYFFAANHAQGSGWGNVMQDFVMMSLLAHTTNRSFVFDDYIWNADGSLYSMYNDEFIPSRIPLSALLGGPIVGGPWPHGDNTPLSVSKEFFHLVCPNATVLQVLDVNTDEMRFSQHISAAYVFEKWVEAINSVEDPCLMLDPRNDRIFDIWIFGDKKRMLTIWPHLANSPVSTHWGWSPLIYDAYEKNRELFEPTRTWLLEWFFHRKQKATVSPIPGLLAIHVRRGDFEGHCVHLSRWSSDWNAFNSFPEFIDKFDPPTGGGGDEIPQENVELYAERCYPSIEQITEKVRRVRVEAADPLPYLYIMTNGEIPWVKALKAKLAKDMEWDRISSSRDLKVTWEQKFVAQALDMYVAQRAQVFIGNGWSSLTSNVVMLRMAQGFEPDTIRFW